MALFGLRRPPRPEAGDRRRVESWVREAGGFGPEMTIKLNEIVCPDPACPGMETVILLMPDGGPTRACKIAKPLSEVTRADIALALALTRDD